MTLSSYHDQQWDWRLTAETGHKQGHSLRLEKMTWRSSLGWFLQAQSAQQENLDQSIFQLSELEARKNVLRVQSPQATLDLQEQSLKGTSIKLYTPYWTLTAQKFRTQVPLQNWKMSGVHVQFQSNAIRAKTTKK